MSGMFTNGMPLATANALTFPLTGNETIPCDTNLTAGSGPESVALTTSMLGLAGKPTVLSDVAATVALTGVNVIAGGTALSAITGGTNLLAPNSGTLSSGTATCSGTAVVSTVLGASIGWTVISK